MKNNFIHLHLHSEYSISDSLIRISDLVEKVSERKSPSVSITDHNNIFSLVKFYKQAIKKGVKPIIGIEIDIKDTESSNESFRIVLVI